MTSNIMANQQFNLRWNNHTNNIVQVFLEHLTSELLVDVTLSCQGRFIKAHRMILSACSPYFQEIFKHHTAKHPVIILNGMRFEDMQMMIKFMYHGEIRVQEAQLDGFLAAAEMLQVKGLSNVRNKYEKGKVQSNNKNVSSTMVRDQTEATKNSITTTVDTMQASMQNIADKGDSSLEQSRVRKRRKMSHTVNELAKETVFASNNTAYRGPEEISAKGSFENECPSLIEIEQSNIQDITTDPANQTPSPNEVKTTLTRGKGKSTGPKSIGVKDKKLKIPEKIPRPPNAFMLFANEWRRKLALEYPSETNTEISVRLGILWKALNVQAKQSYYALAKKVDEEHKRKYPGYYYSPKEARLRKNLKQDLMLARCLPIRELDALRLVKVFMNVDDHHNQTEVVQTSNDNAMDANAEVDDPPALIEQSEEKRSNDEDKDILTLTSVIT